jgi:hypothetical protein
MARRGVGPGLIRHAVEPGPHTTSGPWPSLERCSPCGVQSVRYTPQLNDATLFENLFLFFFGLSDSRPSSSRVRACAGPGEKKNQLILHRQIFVLWPAGLRCTPQRPAAELELSGCRKIHGRRSPGVESGRNGTSDGIFGPHPGLPENVWASSRGLLGRQRVSPASRRTPNGAPVSGHEKTPTPVRGEGFSFFF